MKYDFIIVLSPNKKEHGNFPEFSGTDYHGGQTRMNAAAKIFKKNKETNFIAVGGYDPAEKDEINKDSQKVSDMKEFLENKCRGIKLDGIKSLPCTFHNFVAVFNTLINSGEIENKNIGVLTNFYHLPRAMRFAAEAKISVTPNININLIPICAESIVELKMNDLDTETPAYLKIPKLELSGIKDIESGSYKDNCLDKKYDKFIGVAKKYPGILTTPEEREKYKL